MGESLDKQSARLIKYKRVNNNKKTQMWIKPKFNLLNTMNGLSLHDIYVVVLYLLTLIILFVFLYSHNCINLTTN